MGAEFPWSSLPPKSELSVVVSCFVKTVTDFIFGGSKIIADGDCSHKIMLEKTLGSPLDCKENQTSPS